MYVTDKDDGDNDDGDNDDDDDDDDDETMMKVVTGEF